MRPNYAQDAPPTSIEVGGFAYPCETDYRVWIEVLRLMRELDPDADDEELYQEKAADLGLVASGFEVYDGEFKLGMDCVHGWKALYDACGGGRDSLDLYAKIRRLL